MAKAKTRYVCNSCGDDFPQMYGKCPGCASWGTLQEEIIPTTNTNAIATFANLGTGKSSGKNSSKNIPRESLTLSQITDNQQARSPSGYEELDRVLGGGIVAGSLVLIGGEPGIGKSTLLLGMAQKLLCR